MAERLQPDERDVRLVFDESATELLEEIAGKRSMSIRDMVIESLRVEQLLADGLLFIRDPLNRRRILELTSV